MNKTNKLTLNKFGMKILTNSSSSLEFINIDGAYYVPIRHLEEYKIKLYNNMDVRCDTIISIDGEEAGRFRIGENSSITIERPSDTQRRFIYADEKSSQAQNYGMQVGNKDNGLISIIFKPEKQTFRYSLLNSGMPNKKKSKSLNRNIDYSDNSYGNSYNDSYKNYGFNYENNQQFSSGGTLLGKHSDQNFTTTTPIYDYDFNNITELSSRLITNKQKDPEYISLARKKVNYPKRIDEIDKLDKLSLKFAGLMDSDSDEETFSEYDKVNTWNDYTRAQDLPSPIYYSNKYTDEYNINNDERYGTYKM